MGNGMTSVKGFRIKDGIKGEQFHERLYDPNENKEIWIFGLDDDDYFEVKGDGKGTIALRLVGGQNVDTFNILNGRGVHIYDYKNKTNKFETKKGRVHLKDDYYTNIYDYKKIKYNSKVIVPIIGSNPDDGFKLGVNGTFKKNAYEGENFTSMNSVRAQYYFATSGFDIAYNGEFSEIFNNVNLGIRAKITSPNFAVNFFGFGNSTPNLNAEDDSDGEAIEDLDYNRVKKSTYAISPSLIKTGEYGSRFSAGITFESIEIENTMDRFINDFVGTDSDLERDEFIGADINYNFSNSDNSAFPTLGLNFDLLFGYRSNVNNSRNYSFFVPSLAVNYKLVPSGNNVLATKIQSHMNLGDDYEFYQAASIGGDNGLRGYRNQRFSGKSAFYQSTDIRFNLKRHKTAVIPIESGFYVAFDYGRVWVDDDLVSNPDFNEDRLNTSFGGGLFFNMVHMVTANIGAFGSDDGLRIAFKLGFGF